MQSHAMNIWFDHVKTDYQLLRWLQNKSFDYNEDNFQDTIGHAALILNDNQNSHAQIFDSINITDRKRTHDLFQYVLLPVFRATLIILNERIIPIR